MHLELEPLHLLRCHSKGDRPDDESTELWACAFEPESSSNVAACGGDVVCIIECTSGAVLSKYRVPREELYALAWTLLRFRGPRGRPRPVLVVAGGSGKLHLLYPTENCCYGIIDAHNQPVSTMCFHPSKESLLFNSFDPLQSSKYIHLIHYLESAASYDKTVALWDIGIPDTDLNFSHQKLMTLAVAGVPLKLTPVMACPERGLLAAGVGGCWAWDISLDNSKKYRRHHVKFSFPLIKNTKNGDWRTVDALVFVSDDVIASRSVGQGSLYLWSWARSVQVDGWPARIARPCRAVILAVLPWMITQELYTGLAADPGQNYLVSGAVGGSLYVYNLADIIHGDENAGKCNPQIVQWPGKGNEWEVMEEEEEEENERKEKESLLINSLAMDPSLRFVMALTNKNSVCIWRHPPQA